MLNPLEFRAMLVVADYAASLRFYETLLGLRRVMAWDDGHGPGAVSYTHLTLPTSDLV